jgi:integral membrane sensor domain MASE1
MPGVANNGGNVFDSSARYLVGVLAFAACYIVLDWASFIEPLGRFNITPWNPQPALAIALMVFTGVWQWPVVFVTLVFADIIVRGAPAGLTVTASSAFTLAAGYATMALVLRLGLRDRTLDTARDLALFAATIIIGAALVGGAYVNVLAVSNLLPTISLMQAWLRFWLGDAVGIMITGPLVFALAAERGRERLRALLREPRRWIDWAALCAVLALVLLAVPIDITQDFYLLFVPVIWIAIRSGMAGAIVAIVIVQLGVILGLRASPRHVSLVQLELLVCMLGIAGLFVGVAVDERRRAASASVERLRS